MNTPSRASRAFASRAFLAALLVLVGALVASAGCGRSNLDDYIPPDGGYPDVIGLDVEAGPHPEGGGCSAATCPTGCCDAAGKCETGAVITSCGTAGRACANCQAEGYSLCDPTSHACGNAVVNCGPQNCGGCCDGNVCFAGADPNECGGPGQACKHCQSQGLACSGGQCVTPACGPGNCNGCCFGGQCIGGTDNTACGNSGQVCVNCTAQGEACLAEPGFGGVCEGGNGCSPQNCAGCCSGNVCYQGLASTACGYGGQTCQNCSQFGESCEGQVCVSNTFCGPASCPGCCEGNTCITGESSSACGYGGQQCQNCSAFGDTCNSGVCTSQTTCGPQNCGGCCVGNVCLNGQDSAACGFGGVTCQDCLPFGETCSNGQCAGQATCGPANCPGCCIGNACQAGTSSYDCGFGGGQCQSCYNLGEVCSNQACVLQPSCGPGNCGGCCEGNTCVGGSASDACGFGGAACLDCAASGESCVKGGCSIPTCGPGNCAGCCAGTLCLAGSIDSECGQAGGACTNCTQLGDTCQNNACVAPSTCGPWNCSGCCQGDVCVGGSFGGGFDAGVPFDAGPPPPIFDGGGQPDTACGYGGTACQDCTKLGETCQNEQCLTKCNQFNCAGCCDATQTCQPGFLDTQCGGQGTACTDCTHLAPPSTCDGAAFPVACQSQQTSCPSPYGGCFASPTQAPLPQKVCSASDLLNAKAACATGAYTQACFNFFNVEYQQNFACASCLQPFDYELADGQGVAACVAPYVTASCNQATACDYDCKSYSCGSCSDQTSYDQCRASVDTATGQCATYAQPAQQCEATALAGPAAFCNPAQYAGYGAWLQAVGTSYCGM